MNQQVAAFGETVLQMRRYFRGDNNALNNYLSKCIFYSGMGSNDYLNNYFMPTFYSTSSDYTTKAFAALLLQEYTRQLMVCSWFSNYFFVVREKQKNQKPKNKNKRFKENLKESMGRNILNIFFREKHSLIGLVNLLPLYQCEYDLNIRPLPSKQIK